MRRDQLEHAIRAACDILDCREVIIVGSQAILASVPEVELPHVTTLSREVDILPIAAAAAETETLADVLEGAVEEWSQFDDMHGFYGDGVDLDTCVLPKDWRLRLVKVSNHNTTGPGGSPVYTGWCLDKEYLCVAKLYASREKDTESVRALIEAELVDSSLILERINQTDGDAARLSRATDFVTVYDQGSASAKL